MAVAAVTSRSDGIVKEFHEALQRSPDTAVAVAAIKVHARLVTWPDAAVCTDRSSKTVSTTVQTSDGKAA